LWKRIGSLSKLRARAESQSIRFQIQWRYVVDIVQAVRVLSSEEERELKIRSRRSLGDSNSGIKIDRATGNLQELQWESRWKKSCWDDAAGHNNSVEPRPVEGVEVGVNGQRLQ
jgi:hypothetical protein